MNPEDSSEPDILNVNEIYKSFGIFNKHQVIKGISLKISKGKCVVLMGDNGAGKTTLLKIICGLLNQDSGHVHLNGKISYVPEVSSIYPYLSARESIDLFSNFGEVMYDTNSLLDMLKLPKDSRNYSKDYSKGTKRKTSLGMVMSTQSDLFILDEPFEGLDPKVSEDIVEIIISLKKKSKSFLIASHDLLYSDIIADEIIKIKEGTLDNRSLKSDKNSIIIRFQSSEETVATFLREIDADFDISLYPEVEVHWNGERSAIIKKMVENGIEFDEIRDVHLRDRLGRL